MSPVFIDPQELIASLDAIRAGVPAEFRQGQGKTLGERTKGLSTFFAASNVCAKEDSFDVEVHAENSGNKREALTESFIRLFCDSLDGSKAMTELGAISEDRRLNKNRFGSDVLNGSFSVSGNTTFDYPRPPLWLIQVKQVEEPGQPPTRRITAHESWKSNLAKYLTTPESWRGLALFMLKGEPFETKSAKSDISDAMLVEKIQQQFTKDVAEFLVRAANFRIP